MYNRQLATGRPLTSTVCWSAMGMLPAGNAGVAGTVRASAQVSAHRRRIMKGRMVFLLFLAGMFVSLGVLLAGHPYVAASMCWLTIGLGALYVRRDHVRRRAAESAWRSLACEDGVHLVAGDPQGFQEVLVLRDDLRAPLKDAAIVG